MCLGTTGVITAIHDDDGVPMALIDATDTRNVTDATGGINATAARKEGNGVIRACLLTCQEARVGDTVLVHSGYVLQTFDSGEDLS